MDINELTIGQAKELATMFGANIAVKPSIFDGFIGKYVICRSRNEGVNAGKVLAADETGVILQDARRLYYHVPLNKNLSWYEGVARDGIDPSSKIGAASQKIIVEDYSLTVCTALSEESIRGAKDHAQN